MATAGDYFHIVSGNGDDSSFISERMLEGDFANGDAKTNTVRFPFNNKREDLNKAIKYDIQKQYGSYSREK